MSNVKLFSNYYNFLDKVPLLVNYVSFATKIFNIFKSLVKNVSVRGKIEGERCMSAEGSSVKGSSQQSPTSGPSLREGAHCFQAQAHLLWGVGKQYYTGYIMSLPVWSHVLYGDYDVTACLVPCSLR